MNSYFLVAMIYGILTVAQLHIKLARFYYLFEFMFIVELKQIPRSNY